MTSYLHGVYSREVPTSVRPPVTALAGLPVVVGAAPVVLGDRANVNRPVLATSFAEFVSKLGYSDDLAAYGLCEFARVYFGLYGVGPAVFINVLDPQEPDHLEPVARALLAWAAAETSKTVAAFAIDHTTLVLDDGATPPVAYVAGTDYTLAYDSDGNTVVTRKAGGRMGSGALPACHLTYDKLDPGGVVAADVVGTATAGGANTGLWCLEDVYPRLQLAPGLIVCPGWSQDSAVAAAMVARGGSINGVFKALAVCDLSPDDYEIADYSEAAAWKSDNGFTAAGQVCCWPLVTLGGEVHHLSSHFAGLANQVDAASGGTPYVSPSNRKLQIDGACLLDGTEVFLTQEQANLLNGQGIVTALNFTGWRLWGNRTGAYPGTSDPKDAFVPIRRMNLWLGNTLVLTYFSQVDSALNRRLVDSVVDSANIFLNGLKGAGAILGGEVVFAAADNPQTDLLNGHAKFRIYWTPPPPAEALDFIIEYDVANLSKLFG
ncbi:MAG: phage tail sheath family protein [Myxococcota bacterium]|jgi:phage tail sheath protein FI|nr:phage tail sheath family protein [Myxococcota bacterium]